MNRLMIEYPRGVMVVHVQEFFPCTKARAKKLFGLVKKHCSPAVRAELGAHLYYNAHAADMLHWDPGGLDKARRNYKLYCQMEVDNEWMG